MKNKQTFVLVSAFLVLIFTVVFSQTAQAAIYSPLTVGSRGAQVRELQQRLADLGFYKGPINGRFGKLTKAAVVKFQIANNITPATGYFGVTSRTKLNQLAQSKPITQPPVTLPVVPTPTLTKSSPNPHPISDIFVMQDNGTLVQPTGQIDVRAVARKFYQLNPDEKDTYDFLSIFSTFHDPTSVENHDYVRNNIKNIGLPQTPPFPNNLPVKLLGINFFNDAYNSNNVKSENEIKNNLFLMVHETGHQWLAYFGRDEGISDGSHYLKWVSNGFQRDGKWWGDAIQGWPWKQNNDGTYGVNDINHQGFSNLSLYLMGFVPVSEVSDLQIIVPSDPNEEGLTNVRGSTKVIKIGDLIAKYGERIPSYQNSQKNFRMAYILLTKKGETNYQSNENVLNWISADFPVEWKLVTYNKSTINQ